jgi:hypothetical protein
MNELTEKDLHIALKAAVAINATAEALDVMTDIAAGYIAQGDTQEGADVLAFVLLQPLLMPDSRMRAEDLFEDLESRICPRVLWDAREFASLATFEDVVEYIFLPHEPDA